MQQLWRKAGFFTGTYTVLKNSREFEILCVLLGNSAYEMTPERKI